MADFGFTVRQLPNDGRYKASAWPDLDPHARELFISEILEYLPEYYFDGEINFEDSREPIMRRMNSDEYASIAGEVIQAPGEPLLLGISGGGTSGGNIGIVLLVFAAVYLYIGLKR